VGGGQSIIYWDLMGVYIGFLWNNQPKICVFICSNQICLLRDHLGHLGDLNNLHHFGVILGLPNAPNGPQQGITHIFGWLFHKKNCAKVNHFSSRTISKYQIWDKFGLKYRKVTVGSRLNYFVKILVLGSKSPTFLKSNISISNKLC